MKSGFTHAVDTNAAARLDCTYAATDLMPSLLGIDTAAPNSISACATLRTLHPVVNTWRADLDFLSYTDLRESLERDIVLLAHEALIRSDAARSRNCRMPAKRDSSHCTVQLNVGNRHALSACLSWAFKQGKGQPGEEALTGANERSPWAGSCTCYP
jgi:hypothetical protein